MWLVTLFHPPGSSPCLLGNIFCEFCTPLCTVQLFSISKENIHPECWCTLWKTLDMIRPYSGKGSKNGCGNLSLNILNQKQLENVLEFMTLGLPFTSLEDGWLLQSISHKFVSEYVKETTVY